MNPNDKHISILAEVCNLSVEYLDGCENDYIIHLTEALAAMQKVQDECDEKMAIMKDALNHINHIATNSRSQTKRLNFIAKRAEYAIQGKPFLVDEFDLPKIPGANETLHCRFNRLRLTNNVLEATISELKKENERLKAQIDNDYKGYKFKH